MASTLEQALAGINNYTVLGSARVVVNDDRSITVPQEYSRIAVTTDNNAITLKFDCPKVFGNIDLETLNVYIICTTVTGMFFRIPVANEKASADSIHFDWTIESGITAFPGPISFAIQAFDADTVENSAVVWHSEINNDLRVTSGLNDMRTVYAMPETEILIGRYDENNASKIVFIEPISWAERYGDGVAQLVYLRPTEYTAFPVVLEKTVAGAYIWNVSRTDTEYTGRGKAELRYTVNDAIVKSVIYEVIVEKSLESDEVAPPPPSESYLSQIIEEANKAIAAADRAKAEADRSIQSVVISDTEPVNPDTKVWINPTGEPVNIASINDNIINPDYCWSSRNIIDTLCQQFTVTGPVVTCNPVAGYPLAVKSQIVPKQEGSGDPSPENVRPITPWNGAKLTRCGKNLINPNRYIRAMTDSSGVLNESSKPAVIIPLGANAYLTGPFDKMDSNVVRVGKFESYPQIGSKGLRKNASGNGVITSDGIYKWAVLTFVGINGHDAIDIIHEFSATAGTDACDYIPFESEQSFTATFPEPVYGGEVDWESGKTKKFTQYVLNQSAVYYVETALSDLDRIDASLYQPVDSNYNTICSGLNSYKKPVDVPMYKLTGGRMSIYLPKGYIQNLSTDTAKSWVSQHQDALNIAYMPNSPKEISTTISDTPTALPGVNTLYTDTGDTTVSGRSDPNAVIANQQAQIDELKQAILNQGGNT